MKRVLTSATVLIILFSLQTLTGLAFYSDVPEDHKYYEPISALHNLGRLPDTEFFQPDKTLTKTELYRLLLTYAKAQLTLDIDLPYIDTDNNADYGPYLQTAINLGILKPGNQKEFGVNNTVTKHQVLSTMLNSLGIGINYFFDKENFPFIDINKNSALAALANKAYELGILEENQENYFRMARRITKAQAADYLYKIHNYSPDATITFTISTGGVAQDYNESQQQLLNHQSFATLLDVWSILRDKYFYKDELNEEKLIFGAIKGMTEQVSDIYTVFQEPTEASNLITTLSSEYEGIGLVIELIDNQITVISPFKGSPADEAGILANDIIVEVNDESVEGLTVEAVANKIKGPSGTTVKLKILRDSQTFTFEVERTFILIKTVESEMKHKSNEDIGYIAILSFGEGTYEEFIEAASGLVAQNPDGFIIDLRDNPGGYMDVAVNMLGLFTDEIQTAVSLEYVNGVVEEYKTNGNGLLDGYKIVVLINEGSASASEIMAGTLQDLDRAKIIGTKSFGKGVVQELLQYSDNSLFKYTVSKWLTPDGHNVNDEGITPDKIIENAGTTDSQLASALAEF